MYHHLDLKQFCAMSDFGQCNVYLLFHKFINYIPQRLRDLLPKRPLGATSKIQNNDLTDQGTFQTFISNFHPFVAVP